VYREKESAEVRPSDRARRRVAFKCGVNARHLIVAVVVVHPGAVTPPPVDYSAHPRRPVLTDVRPCYVVARLAPSLGDSHVTQSRDTRRSRRRATVAEAPSTRRLSSSPRVVT